MYLVIFDINVATEMSDVNLPLIIYLALIVFTGGEIY